MAGCFAIGFEIMGGTFLRLEEQHLRMVEFMKNITYGIKETAIATAFKVPVTIEVPVSLANDYVFQCLVFTIANELFRLEPYCPPLNFAVPANMTNAGLPLVETGNIRHWLSKWVDKLPYRPTIRFSDYHNEHPHLRIRIGQEVIRVACCGWNLVLEEDESPTWDETLPIIAAITATVVVTEIVKRLLHSFIPSVRPICSLNYSFYDYALHESGAPVPPSFKIPGAVLVGAGGIGSAFIYGLLLQRNVSGDIVVIDHDKIDKTNLNRILYALSEDIGSSKAEMAKRLLEGHTAITVQPKLSRWAECFNEVDHSLILGALDDDDVRKSIQSDLPKVYLDGGTGVDNWRVSRHDVLDSGCIFCLTADQSGSDLLELREIGILQAAITRKYETDEQVNEEDLAFVDDHLNDVFLGRTLRDGLDRYHASEVCGMTSYLNGQHMSAPHLSSMPGLLMALEVLKMSLDAKGPFHRFENVLRGNVRGRLHSRTCSREVKPGCVFCGNDAYRSRYRIKWGLESQ